MSIRSRLPAHSHDRGGKRFCRCSFGQQEPYVSPKDREVYGSKESMWHEASKYDWLKGRPDVQDSPQLQWALESLAHNHPEHDALFPWLLRELKKGRLTHHTYHHGSGEYAPTDEGHSRLLLNGTEDPEYLEEQLQRNPSAFKFQGNHGIQYLTDDTLDQIQDWMKYQKQAKKGIDIMGHHIGDAVEKAQKNDIGGQVVHEFPNGYSVVHLRNKRDMVQEGDRMNHCVGSNGMGYIEKNDEGKGLYYSLRTPDNEPVGTAELTPTEDYYYKCPEDGGHFTTAVRSYDHNTDPEKSQFGPILNEVCPQHGTVLGTMDPETRTWKFHAPHHEIDLKKIAHAPTSEATSISQMFGPHDHKMDDWHEDMFNQFFGNHGHSYYQSDGEGEEEYEPWWDSTYYVDPPSSIGELLDHAAGEYYEYSPEEYDRAVADAEEHDVEPPDLEVPDSYDWDIDSLFNDLTTDELDPERIAAVWKAMEDNHRVDDWNDRAREWLDEEYKGYLDPYGKGENVYKPRHQVPFYAEPAPGMPGVHYPESHPDEDYFARNLMHHLGKYRDPLTGEEYNTKSELAMQGNPPFHRMNPYSLDNERQPWGPELGDPDLMAEHSGLGVQQQYKGPYQNDFDNPEWHNLPEEEQLAPGGYRYQDAPSTTDPSYWQVGNRQRMLFPMGWYTDHSRGRVRQSQLPEHLFPPDKFQRHMNRAPDQIQDPYMNGNETGQLPMWHPVMRDGTPGALLNTQAEAPDPRDNYRQDNRPTAWGWQAKTAGEWTDVEEAGGKERPKRGEQGLGVFGPNVYHAPSVPHLNGKVAEFAGDPKDAFLMPEFSWRVPVVHDRHEDRYYVGKPAMEHTDMMKLFHHASPWADAGRYNPGFIDVGNVIGGGVEFYNDNHDIDPAFENWVEQRFGTRKQNGPLVTPEDIEWSSQATGM